MKNLRTFSRILVGLVLIFSGFVKGVDPLGTAYKITDYFEAYHMIWASPLSLYLSILLCAFEFVLGVLLVINVKMKQVAWLVLLLMSFFTAVTFYDALYSPVPDCGCFGDAIVLTNWETFYKNLVLMVFVLIVFLGRNKIKAYFTTIKEFSIIGIVSLLFIWFSVYNYRNLPLINFRPWKVGNKMMSDNPQPSKFYLVYKNKQSGETKEYLSNELPWQDTVWVANWEYVSTREDNPNKSLLGAFAISDSAGTDMTEHFVRNPEFQFFIASYNIKEANKEAFEKLNPFIEKANSKGISIIILTGSSSEEIAEFKKLFPKMNYEIYTSDDIALKAMIRSNPGLVLLKNAVVLGQWHWRNIPDFDEVEFDKLEKEYVK
jgi:uncharacterized membrane protein YphA (DoxX/SURF4 family)